MTGSSPPRARAQSYQRGQPGDVRGLETVNDPGTLCWTELYPGDVAGAKSFYQAAFGWVTEDMPMGDFTYTVIKPADGGEESAQGGMMPLTPDMAAGGTMTSWRVYFEVANCDATVAAGVQHGGTVIVPATDIPGVGRFAMLIDPAGAVFAVITSSAA